MRVSTISNNLSRSGANKFQNGNQNSSRVIEAGAGFFVIASGTGESVTFTEACKRPNLKSNSDNFKTESSLRCNELSMGVRFANDSIPENDNSLFQWNMNYTGIVDAKDEFDSPKLFGGFLGCGPVSPDDVWMSIDRRPGTTDKTFVLPLRVKTPESNAYKLTFGTCPTNKGDYTIQLVDKQTKSVVPVRDGSLVPFQRVDGDSMIENRFELLFTLKNNDVLTNTESINPMAINVYPNPSSNGKFMVTFDGKSGFDRVECYNLQGSKVYSSTVSGSYHEFSLNSKGMFVVRMIGNAGTTQSVIISQ